MRRAGGRGGIHIDPDASCGVGGGLRQPDHRAADGNHEVVVLVGQTADAGAASVAVEDFLARNEAVGVAEVDRVDVDQRSVGDGNGRVDRHAERVGLAGGGRAADVDDRQGCGEQFDREGVDDQHSIAAAAREPAAVDAAGCAGEGIGDDAVVGKTVGFGERDGVGGRVIYGLPLAEGDRGLSGGRQRPGAAAPWAGPQIDHEWIQSRGIHQTHGRVAHERHGVGRPLREAGDARAAAVVVDHPVAATEGVRVAEIDRVLRGVNRVGRDEGRREALGRARGSRLRQIDDHRNVFQGIGLIRGQLECALIDRVGNDVIGATIDQPADCRPAPGAIDHRLTASKPVRPPKMNTFGVSDDRRRRRECPPEIVLVPRHARGVEIEPQAVARARARMRDGIEVDRIPILGVGPRLGELHRGGIDPNNEINPTACQAGQISSIAPVVDDGIPGLKTVHVAQRDLISPAVDAAAAKRRRRLQGLLGGAGQHHGRRADDANDILLAIDQTRNVALVARAAVLHDVAGDEAVGIAQVDRVGVGVDALVGRCLALPERLHFVTEDRASVSLDLVARARHADPDAPAERDPARGVGVENVVVRIDGDRPSRIDDRTAADLRQCRVVDVGVGDDAVDRHAAGVASRKAGRHVHQVRRGLHREIPGLDASPRSDRRRCDADVVDHTERTAARRT